MWRRIAIVFYLVVLSYACFGSFGQTATDYLKALGLRSPAGMIGWLVGGMALGYLVLWLRMPAQKPPAGRREAEQLRRLQRELDDIQIERERRTHRHSGSKMPPV